MVWIGGLELRGTLPFDVKRNWKSKWCCGTFGFRATLEVCDDYWVRKARRRVYCAAVNGVADNVNIRSSDS